MDLPLTFYLLRVNLILKYVKFGLFNQNSYFMYFLDFFLNPHCILSIAYW